MLVILPTTAFSAVREIADPPVITFILLMKIAPSTELTSVDALILRFNVTIYAYVHATRNVNMCKCNLMVCNKCAQHNKAHART